jgi:hypothetical protein
MVGVFLTLHEPSSMILAFVVDLPEALHRSLERFELVQQFAVLELHFHMSQELSKRQIFEFLKTGDYSKQKLSHASFFIFLSDEISKKVFYEVLETNRCEVVSF